MNHVSSSASRSSTSCSSYDYYTGRTALHIAIENENIEMVECLLKKATDVGDALLHAINEENVEAVELILEHEENGGKPLDKWVRDFFFKYFLLLALKLCWN